MLRGLLLSIACVGFTLSQAYAQDEVPAPAPAPAAPLAEPAPEPEAPPAQTTRQDRAVPTLVVPNAPSEQKLPIMTIDQDALFLRSAWGRRAQVDLEKRGRELADENERLAEQLSSEEQELTQLRKTLSADEFRTRADEFDKRVVEVRRERDEKARELARDADAERTAFFQAALPILAVMMQERGAVAVFDQRMLFVSSDSIDATAALIARVDQEAGEGPVAKNLPAVRMNPEPGRGSEDNQPPAAAPMPPASSEPAPN